MRRVNGKTYYTKPWFDSYRSMMDRCYRSKAANYSIYGGRGIKVCEEWKDIECFEKWVESSGYVPGMTIERINVNGDYTPENCKWATRMEQANNRRNTVYLTYKGKTKSMCDFARELGLNLSTVTNRYYRGMPVEKVLYRGDLRGKR